MQGKFDFSNAKEIKFLTTRKILIFSMGIQRFHNIDQLHDPSSQERYCSIRPKIFFPLMRLQLITEHRVRNRRHDHNYTGKNHHRKYDP